jgi:DNA invertase Pin-like site-specific DNA recombinase
MSIKPIVGYVRVSTEGQAVEGVSLDAQEARIRAWAASSGSTLASLHADTLSGSRAANRPGLQTALSEVCQRRGVLAVFSLSRLARSTKDALAIAERLEKAGADLVSLSERIDTTTAAGKMVFRMLAVLAEFERDLISERTSSAMAHLRRTGRRISGRVPFGYDLRGESLIPNQQEQAAVALIRSLRSKGRSLRGISQELRKRGIRTKGGSCDWSPKVLAAVIRRAEKGRAAA